MIGSSSEVQYITWPTFVCTFLPVQQFIPSQKPIKVFFRKILKIWLEDRHYVFTLNAVVDKIHVHKSTNVSKLIDEQMLDNFTQCVNLWLHDSTKNGSLTQIFKNARRWNKSRSFKTMAMSFFHRVRRDCRKIENFHTTGTQEKIECFKADGFCGYCNAVFEALTCFYHYCLCQDARPALTEEDIQRGTKKGNLMKHGDSMSRRKVRLLKKFGNMNGGNSTRLMCQ